MVARGLKIPNWPKSSRYESPGKGVLRRVLRNGSKCPVVMRKVRTDTSTRVRVRSRQIRRLQEVGFVKVMCWPSEVCNFQPATAGAHTV